MENAIATLREREMLAQISDPALETLLGHQQVAVYAGFDPTHPSLHLGNLIPIMGLAHFQRAGHQPIAICGGATGLIGDPSGKKQERVLLDTATVEANVASQREQLAQFLDFDCKTNPALLLNNYEWLGSMKVIEFLRDIGKHFRLSSMLAKDSVKSRMEADAEGMSFTEFNYQIMQAYDFLYLFEHHGCQVQLGGSDQWGNITAGIDLIHKKLGAQAYGCTLQLLTTATGAKFGKSEAGAIYLSAKYTSPYKMYQYWINTDDRDVIRLLKYFTFLSLEEIESLRQQMEEKPEQRIPQKRLAMEATSMIHGAKAAEAARQASEIIFGGQITDIDDQTLEEIFSEVPSVELPFEQLAQGLGVIDLLQKAGVCASKGQARRLIQQGGFYLNNQRCTDLDLVITPQHLASEGMLVVRSGKKKYFLVKFTR